MVANRSSSVWLCQTLNQIGRRPRAARSLRSRFMMELFPVPHSPVIAIVIGAMVFSLRTNLEIDRARSLYPRGSASVGSRGRSETPRFAIDASDRRGESGAAPRAGQAIGAGGGHEEQ